MAKKLEPMEDDFAPDGTRLFNPKKPHGTVYADGFTEARFFQEGVLYRVDRYPVGYGAKVPTLEPATLHLPEKKLHWKQQKKLEEATGAASGAP
jgi:hypothetical protein